MTNLLALLVSLAMLLTGAPGGENAGVTNRTLKIENLEIACGDESLTLQPSVTLGIQTDGNAAAFDFYVAKDEERLLPLQLATGADSLLLAVGDDVYAVPPELIGMGSDDEAAGRIIEMYQSTVDVYREMFKLLKDPEGMAAFQAEADRIYDEMIDLGPGTPEKLVYEGETYDVTTYEYDLTGEQIAALTDAVYAQNEALSAYGEAYFRMLAALPEEAGFSGVDSWAALMAKTPVEMHVVESRAESGLKIQDVSMRITAPGLESPVTTTVHSARNGDSDTATLNSQFDAEAMSTVVYMEYTRDGAEVQGSVTITGNPPENAAATGEQAENGAETADEEEDDDEGDGESDGEDMLYCAIDFSYIPEELTNLEVSLDAAGGPHASLGIDIQPDDEGGTTTYVTMSNRVGEDDLKISFEIAQTSEPFDLRAVAEEGDPPEALNILELMTALGADVEKLMQDEDIQQAEQLVEKLGADGEASEADAPVDVEAPEPAGDGRDIFNPEFTYLPAGFTQSDVIVDRDNRYVSLTFTNSETRMNLYVSLGDVQSIGAVSRYVTGADGECVPLEGLLVTREDYGDYAMYAAEKDGVAYSVYPDGGDISPGEVVKLLDGIRFN